MLAPTHLVFSQACFLGMCIVTGHAPTYAEALVAAVGSLLPDLDTRQSLAGRLLLPLSGWLEYQFGHRTFTHALVPQLVIGALLYYTLPFGWFLAVMSGWVSHSVADMMTPSGVAWFWPSPIRCVLPGNEAYRMESMSYGELSFAGILAVLTFPLLAWANVGEGTAGLIQAALGRLESAREQYDAEKGEWAWTLELQGKHNWTHADVSGTYPVRGHWGENGFLLESGSGPVTVCRSSHCDWYAEHAVLVRGAPEQTTTRTLTAEQATGAELAEQIRSLEASGQVYVLGTLTARRASPQPPTVEVAGETVTLQYASAQDLAALGPVRSAELVVQVRHPPGAEVAELAQAHTPRPSLDPLLEKWLR
jgi:inner membrane protein